MRRISPFPAPLLAAALLATGCAPGPAPGTPGADGAPLERIAGGLILTTLDRASPTPALLQAVGVADDGVVWLSGHEGRWLRSEDAGRTWFAGLGPGADNLQFRDVEAFDAATTLLLSAGEGPASRIYRTDDGGLSWRLQYVADDPAAFLDCMAFWDRETGIVYGDAVDGSLFVLRTVDGGATWTRLEAPAVPAAQPGEGGFAASGTCAVAGPGGRGWIATGNAERARVLVTDDAGVTWRAVVPPVVGGEGGGLTSLDVLGPDGVAVGGVLDRAAGRGAYVALTSDGGRTWSEGGALAMAGPAYGVALVPGLPGPVAVAVGPGGMDWSADGGRSWMHADDRTFWAVGFGERGTGWAVGPGGRIVELRIGR